MSPPLIAACLWVLASSITAMLPMRQQIAPGLALLIAAPLLLSWIALAHGPWITLFATLAVLSLFRRPLVFFARKALSR